MINQNPLQTEYDNFKSYSWKHTQLPKIIMSEKKVVISKSLKKLDKKLDHKQKDIIHSDLMEAYTFVGNRHLLDFFNVKMAKRYIDFGLSHYKKMKQPIFGSDLAYKHFKQLSSRINKYLQMKMQPAY